MNQKQKNNRDIFIFFISIFLIISLCFIIFVPKISSKIFVQKRELAVNNLISSIQTERKINPQAYWEFREFYSPGHFDFSKSGIEKEKIEKMYKEIGITPKGVNYYFLVFNSDNLKSLDGLTTKPALINLLGREKLNINKVLFEDKDSIVYKDELDHLYIIYVLPTSEMLTANGFFEYNNKNDIALMKGKYWVNITRLK